MEIRICKIEKYFGKKIKGLVIILIFILFKCSKHLISLPVSESNKMINYKSDQETIGHISSQ